MARSLSERIADTTAPLPPIAESLATLERRAAHRFETKARNRRAIKTAHLALHEVLQMLDVYAKYPDLVSRGVVDDLHRKIRRRLGLDDPKRGPL